MFSSPPFVLSASVLTLKQPALPHFHRMRLPSLIPTITSGRGYSSPPQRGFPGNVI